VELVHYHHLQQQQQQQQLHGLGLIDLCSLHLGNFSHCYSYSWGYVALVPSR